MVAFHVLSLFLFKSIKHSNVGHCHLFSYDQTSSIIINRNITTGHNHSQQQQEVSDKESLFAHDKSNLVIKNPTSSPGANKPSLIAESKLKMIESSAANMNSCSNNNNNNNSGGSATITTMESGGIKVTYDKPANSIKHTTTYLQEDSHGRMAR